MGAQASRCQIYPQRGCCDGQADSKAHGDEPVSGIAVEPPVCRSQTPPEEPPSGAADAAAPPVHDASQGASDKNLPSHVAVVVVPPATASTTSGLHATGSGRSISQNSLTVEAPCAQRTRAIRAFVPLQRLGRLLRTEAPVEVYHRSRLVNRIDQFWSHSWSAPTRQKLLTLCLYYNGLPGCICALVASILGAAAVPSTAPAWVARLAATFSGVLTFIAVLFVWPCQEQVFLDRACIDQTDEHTKRQGIMSLGQTLQKSRTLLVLWDESYFTRLWCTFEFAAFKALNKDRDAAGDITIRPCFMGALTMALFGFNAALIMAWSGANSSRDPSVASAGSPATVARSVISMIVSGALAFFVIELGAGFRRHLQALERQVQQVANYTTDSAACFCCANGHVHPDTLQAIPCDRDLIADAIAQWFGSLPAFDEHVRSEVLSRIQHRTILPYRYAVLTGMPWLWERLGFYVWLVKRGQPLDGAFVACKGLYVATLETPVAWACVLACCDFFRRGATQGMGNVCQTAKASCAVALTVAPLAAVSQASFQLVPGWYGLVVAAAFYGAINLVLHRRDAGKVAWSWLPRVRAQPPSPAHM